MMASTVLALNRPMLRLYTPFMVRAAECIEVPDAGLMVFASHACELKDYTRAVDHSSRW